MTCKVTWKLEQPKLPYWIRRIIENSVWKFAVGITISRELLVCKQSCFGISILRKKSKVIILELLSALDWYFLLWLFYWSVSLRLLHWSGRCVTGKSYHWQYRVSHGKADKINWLCWIHRFQFMWVLLMRFKEKHTVSAKIEIYKFQSQFTLSTLPWDTLY